VYQNCIIPYLYEAQHVSGDTPPIIRSLKLHWQPLVFHKWKVVRRVVGGRCPRVAGGQGPQTTRPTTFYVWKTRGFQCSFRLLMMGGVSPETCWASYKYGIIKFWYIFACLTLVDLQLDAQNSYLFTYNTFIKILYMFRALPCSSSGGLRRNCIYAASGIFTVCRWLSCAPVKKELSSFFTGAQDSHHCLVHR